MTIAVSRPAVVALWAVMALALIVPARAEEKSCRKLVLGGEVKAGQEWRASLGQGWVFRLVPIPPGPAGYTGWDLVVDTERPAGYPDGLLLASPPYHSISARELGTTYGLRAQDALGWNPRSFRFFTDTAVFHEARELYSVLAQAEQPAGAANPAASRAMARILDLQKEASTGEFRIVDARLAPGSADAAHFAESWALAFPRMPHTIEGSAKGVATARGELHWIRFSLTVWLPRGWPLAAGVRAEPSPCR